MKNKPTEAQIEAAARALYAFYPEYDVIRLSSLLQGQEYYIKDCLRVFNEAVQRDEFLKIAKHMLEAAAEEK